MKKNKFSGYIKSFDFKNLFNELGWDNFDNQLPIAVNEDAFMLKGIVEKKGFVILQCPPLPNGKIPLSSIRKQIEAKVAKHYFEHLIIYSDQIQNQQIWQIAIKEENKPKQVREISWYSHQDTEILFQRLKNLLFTLDEEEQITIVDVKQRISENFAKNTDKVTKKFYTEFKKQHTLFLDFIQGIDDHIGDKENTNKQWYASLMLNRLMFCYFIQKKGFLNQDFNYLQNKLKESSEKTGKDNFYSFYRSFLLELFHDGLGKPEKHRHEHPIALGKIPYLNGGLFDVHELEQQFSEINISDDAFTKLFGFFDQWNWHLDNSIEATGRDINPDVIGYIFEKYINDRASMGAYYTKEDITDYIGKNTIIPFLFDETERHYKKGFEADSELWDTLKQSGDTYIYDAVKKGIPQEGGLFDDLPKEIKKGFQPGIEKEIVQENTSPHLWETRKVWNTKAPEEIALPTEIYRELIERRKRYAEIKSKIENGEIKHINDFITYNLNIRQFTQDIVENTNDAAFIRHFYKAIKKITILDPTCGSGAFLFAALNILEPLYEACIIRMEQFVAEEKNKHKFFEETLDEINSEQHPNLQYYIFKNIILNNLYGVDIMKEAVEIAKLRLFLKLVATVDVNARKENYGLEPLPDIDFNVRAGNTLIGFATEKELLETIEKKEGLFAQDKLDEFKEEFAELSQLYQRFQDAQLITDQGSDSFKAAKTELNKRLNTLNHKLNVYLATNYGIDAELKPEQFQQWLTTHQPFHWFAEFYQIVAGNDGFDVIIGNPPYVEYSKTKKQYSIGDYITKGTGNLYSYVFERSSVLSSSISKIGLIIPLSICSGLRMTDLRSWVINNLTQSYISNFEIFPSKLFDGAFVRVSIVFGCKNKTQQKRHISKLHRWYSIERQFLVDSIQFQQIKEKEEIDLFRKFSDKFNENIFSKISQLTNKRTVSHFITKNSKYFIYYQEATNYWMKAVCRVPYYKKNGIVETPDHGRIISFNDAESAESTMLSINSSLFYLWYSTFSDGFHLSDFLVKNYPFENPIVLADNKNIYNNLDSSIENNSVVGNRNTKKGDIIEIEEFRISKSKPIIDQIDTVLAQHYGFTEEELDFIINYDIKYRMGKELNNGEDEE